MRELHLVTGGAGFIGSHLARKLAILGKKVRIVDNLSTGRIENISDIPGSNVEFIKADIRHGVPWMNGVTHVYHLAALGSVPRSLVDPIRTEQVNVIGTLNILEMARKIGVQRFVFSSSSSVYGNSTIFPRHESDATHPASPYALSKLTAEHYCTLYNELYQLPVVLLRYFNVFGPRQRSDGQYCALIPIFIKAVMEGKAAVIEGSGLQMRDFTYVDTVVEATISAGVEEDAVGETINVAGGQEHSVVDVLNFIEDGCQKKVMRDFQPKRKGDAPRSLADISQMKDILGVEPTPFAPSLLATIESYR